MNATTPMIVNRSLLLVGLLLATSSCADTGVAAEAAPPAVETPAVVEEGTPAPEAPVDPPQEEEGTDHAEVVEDAAGAASAQPSSPQAEWTGATANCTAPGTLTADSAFPVSVDIIVSGAGATIEPWRLGPAGFLIDGQPLAERTPGTAVALQAGSKISLSFDLAPWTAGRTGTFALSYDAPGASAPISVTVVENAPDDLDFTAMAVEDLSGYRVLMQTNRGDMLMEFWPDVAPNHVRNFLDLCYTGFYDGLTFHRVIPGFMIQGGDPTGTGGGNGPRTLKAEFNDRKHLPGVLSMARSASPDSASCQFFVMHGVSTHLDGKYSAFGRLVSGLEVVNQIVTTPRGAGDKPRAPQKILKAIVVPFAKKAVSR